MGLNLDVRLIEHFLWSHLLRSGSVDDFYQTPIFQDHLDHAETYRVSICDPDLSFIGHYYAAGVFYHLGHGGSSDTSHL